MLFLFLACSQNPSSVPSFFVTPKEDTSSPQDSGDSGDSADSGDSVDSGDSRGDSDSGAGCDTASEACDSATGRAGQSAAELSGEPGGFGCNSTAGAWGGVLGLVLVVQSLRKK